MTRSNHHEAHIWKKAYNIAFSKLYSLEFRRLIKNGYDEKEARYIARNNADFRAKDEVYSEVTEYRKILN